MSKCSLCGKPLVYSWCLDCTALYERDVQMRHYSEAFLKANAIPTQLEWTNCRLAGKREEGRLRDKIETAERASIKAGKAQKTEEEIEAEIREGVKREIERIAQVCLDNRARNAREAAKTPAQRRAEKERELNKSYPY